MTAQLFEPLKRRFQTWVDTVFDRHKYDYRKALVEFGRGLSSETDLDAVLRSIVDRLPSTLLVAKVAVFLADDPANVGAFRLAASHGLPFSEDQMLRRWTWASLTSTRESGTRISFSRESRSTRFI